MAYYIKVTRKVADALQLTPLRNKTADGCVLLWQADVDRIKGKTIQERATNVGGALLTPYQAKDETDGTAAYPAEVFTPVAYGGTGKPEVTVEQETVTEVVDETAEAETPTEAETSEEEVEV